MLPDQDLDQPAWIAPGELGGTTVRVVLEQGIGDTLHFIRYVRLLTDRGARVEVATPIHTVLLPLLKEMPEIAAMVPEAGALPAADVVVPLLSVPLALGTTLATIPNRVPYLTVPEDRRRKWRSILAEREAGRGGGPRVGVVWSGSPTHANDRYRSIPLQRFRRILERTDVRFHVLSDRLRDGDAEDLGDLAMHHPGLEDFGDTAALVEMMDLVIAVDTSVAHLAGGLGRPTWVLLPNHPDWRWLLDRDDSPWYPTMRLFRQRAMLDWDSVLGSVSEALDERYR
ncbi:MAG: hypothetical protein J0M16_11135 [Gammaproteobacteria bacterium]|nr:hypothetical protein [Gammaproteobacteria bacterium]